MKKLDAYRVFMIYEGAGAMLFALVFTFNLVYQTTVAGLTPLQLVLVGTFLEASVFLFEVPTGVVADVYSRRLSVITGVFIIGSGFLIEGSFPVFAAIIAGEVLWGIGYTFTSGATQAWITDEIGEGAAGKAFLRGSQAGQVGGLVGLALSMALVNVRVNLPIQVGGALFLVLGLFLALFMPENGFTPTPKEQRESWGSMLGTFRGGLNMVRIRPALLSILGVGLFYGLYSEAFDRLWVKLILDHFTLPGLGWLEPVQWFAILRVLGLVLSAGAIEIVRRRVNTEEHGATARFLMGITAALIVGLVIFALSGSFWIAVAAELLVGVTRRVIDPLYVAWVNQRLDSRVRATVISMSSQVDAIGQIAGGPALGMVGNLFGVRAAIASAAVVLSPILLLYARTIKANGVELPEPAPELD